VSSEAGDREHPSAEELAGYQAEALSAKKSDAIQEHVASCSLCIERLLDLQRFLEFAPEPSREGVADLETASSWQGLKHRIHLEAERKIAVSPRSLEHGFFNSARGGYLVAASALAVAVALGIWNRSLVEKNREPMAVRTVRTLVAAESLRNGVGEGENLPAIHLPAQITLNLPVETPDPLYRVELSTAGGQEEKTSFKITPQETELRFLLPQGSLPPGRYQVKVQGSRDGQPTPQIWTYELTIIP
jgi:hypothetical protein